MFENPSRDENYLSKFYERYYGLKNEAGYFYIQATKPDTIGSVLSDSPAGFAGYMFEKFSTCKNRYTTKSDAGLFEKFTIDEFLTNVMIYWVTNSITSSVRYFKENVAILFNSEYNDFNNFNVPKQVPVGLSFFTEEIYSAPTSILSDQYDKLVHVEHLPRGGQFPALEEPQILSDDLKRFVQKAVIN